MSKLANLDNIPSIASPYLMVKDVDKAVDFYQKAFGFILKDRAPGQDGSTWHAEMFYQKQLIMLGKEGGHEMKDCVSPVTSKVECPICMYLYCENVDNFYQQAIAAGAHSVLAPEDMFWGDRMCRLKDIDGYIWGIATPLEK